MDLPFKENEQLLAGNLTIDILDDMFKDFDIKDDFIADVTDTDQTDQFNFLEDVFEERNDDDVMKMLKDTVAGFPIEDIFVQNPYKKSKPWHNKTNYLLQSLKNLLPVDIYINRQKILNTSPPIYLSLPIFFLSIKKIIETHKVDNVYFYHELYEYLCSTYITMKNRKDDFSFEFYQTDYICYHTIRKRNPTAEYMFKVNKSKNVKNMSHNTTTGDFIFTLKVDLDYYLTKYLQEYGCTYIKIIKDYYYNIVQEEEDENDYDDFF